MWFLRQAREIEVEFHGAGFVEAIGFEVFEDVFVKLQLPFFNAAIVKSCEFDAGESDRIQFHEYFVAIKVALEILMYYIATLRHDHFFSCGTP